jgi:hypothetical protein
MSNHEAPRSKRRRFAPIALLAGVAGAVLLSLSMTNTLSAFTASITNTTNTAGSGTLAMQETNSDGSIICNSSLTGTASCATINKYGGSTTLIPGAAAQTTTIKIKNTGSIAASTFTLTPSACTSTAQSGVTAGSGNLCQKLNVVIKANGTQVYSGTAAGLTAVQNLTSVAPGTTVTITFDVSIDTSADNTIQGLVASQPLTWTFTS